MTTSESKGRFFLQNESIRIDSNRELECSTVGHYGSIGKVLIMNESKYSESKSEGAFQMRLLKSLLWQQLQLNYGFECFGDSLAIDWLLYTANQVDGMRT